MNAWKWMMGIICFNIGVLVIGTISVLSQGTYYAALGTVWDISALTLTPVILGFAGAAVGGAIGTIILNYDPIKLAGITGFIGLMAGTLYGTTNIFRELAGTNPMLQLFVSIFIAFMALITLVFVYQLATQGFKSMD